jgi:hypothetical protein
MLLLRSKKLASIQKAHMFECGAAENISVLRRSTMSIG